MYAPEGFKAVCYRCSFESIDGLAQRCPVCNFAFILEPETTPPAGRRLEDVLNRSSVRGGAPLLPGVDAEKRGAQLMAERRLAERIERSGLHRLGRDRIARGTTDLPPPNLQAVAPAVAAPVAALRRGGTSIAEPSVAAPRGRGRGRRLGFLCAALVASAALAAFQFLHLMPSLQQFLP